MGTSRGRFVPRLGLLLALGLVAAGSGCRDAPPQTVYGELIANPGAVDFGQVALHGSQSLDLTFQNVGRSKVQIVSLQVKAKDGAFQTAFPHSSDQLISPGEQGHLTVRFAPRAVGSQGASIWITTSSQLQPRLEIPLKGIGVDAKAEVLTPALDFGRIEAQMQETFPVELKNPSVLPVQVTGQFIGADADEFSADGVTLQPGEQKELLATFSPQRVGTKDVALTITPCLGCGDDVVAVTAVSLDKAVIAEPAMIDLGATPVDQHKVGATALHNISTLPMTVTGWDLVAPFDPSFSLLTPSIPVTLQPDQRQTLQFEFSPTHMGAASNGAEYHEQSVRNPSVPFQLQGWGGTPEICIFPNPYDYGTQPVGSKTWTVVTVRNCGSSDSKPLVIDGAAFVENSGQSSDEFNLPTTLAGKFPVTLAAGQQFTFKAYFEPVRTGPANAQLEVMTNAPSQPDSYLNFQGNAQLYPPCNITLTPSAINFGTITAGLGAVLGVKVSNQTTTVCAVKNIQVSDSANGIFFLPGGEIDGVILNPGDFFAFQVAAKLPMVQGTFTGAVAIPQSNPANPVAYLPLTVDAQKNVCLVATPPFLDFGLNRPDCPPAPLTVTLRNQCTRDVEVTNVALGPGTDDTEYQLTSVPGPMPITMAPGATIGVTAQYRAQVGGQNFSPLFVTATGLPAPFLVPLLGESSTKEDQVDHFTQQASNQLDVLFVIHNTVSMASEQPLLQQAIPAFVNAAQSKGIDIHLGVTTSGLQPESTSCPGGAQGGEAGRLFPADNTAPRILTLTTANLAAALQHDAAVGECTSQRSGLEAMELALSSPLVDSADDPLTPLPNDGNGGFLRSQAALAVVFVASEDDTSPDTVQDYVYFARSLKGLDQPQRSMFYGIVPDSTTCSTQGGTGSRYVQAIQETGGTYLSDCASDYTPALLAVLNKSFGPQTSFPLSHVPMSAADITVTVDGAVVTNWTYDAPSNAIVFSAPPAAGANIQASYVKACGSW